MTSRPATAAAATSSAAAAAAQRRRRLLPARRTGLGRLVASSVSSGGGGCGGGGSSTNKTVLTTVSHRAPVRWVPVVGLDDFGVGGTINGVGGVGGVGGGGGGSLAYQCHYGGGYLPNDRTEIDVAVEPNARLGILTQGHNAVYAGGGGSTGGGCNTGIGEGGASSHARYAVEPGGLLVVAPDPTRLHEASTYRQRVDVRLVDDDHDEGEGGSKGISNLCHVDWFCGGRESRGEMWHHSYCQASTRVSFNDDVPVLVDSVEYRRSATTAEAGENNYNDDTDDPHFGFVSYATVLLRGPLLSESARRFDAVQRALFVSSEGGSGASIRGRRLRTEGECDDDQRHPQPPPPPASVVVENLSGRTVASLSEVDVPPFRADGNVGSSNPLRVARFASTSNEDLYRLLHYCMEPLAVHFGSNSNRAFYADRIRAVRSPAASAAARRRRGATQLAVNGEAGKSKSPQQEPASPVAVSKNAAASPVLDPGAPSLSMATNTLWSACMLVDSALPVGGFAHSSGLEAAAQVLRGYRGSGGSGNGGGDSIVDGWVPLATRSAAQLGAPFVAASHALTAEALGELISSSSNDDPQAWSDRWLALDRQLHVRLASNPQGCAASLDQGKNLLRVARSWLSAEAEGADVGIGSSPAAAASCRSRFVDAMQQAVMDASATSLTGRGVSSCGHSSTTFGAVAALLGLTADEACHLLAYTCARDVVSAAVRLNLVGPLASVGLLSKTQRAAERGIRDGMTAYRDAVAASSSEDVKRSDAAIVAAASAATACAPLLDCVQPCHDLLAVRLFRT